MIFTSYEIYIIENNTRFKNQEDDEKIIKELENDLIDEFDI